MIGTLGAMSYSWWRVWRVGPLMLTVAACGSDRDAVTCGEGTALKDGKCILQCDAGTVLHGGQCVSEGAAGSAGQGGSGSKAGSAGSADAGSAGESEAEAGSAGESSNGGSGGLGGSGGSAGAGLGGSGGVAGSGLTGSGGTAGALGASGGSGGSGLGGSGGGGAHPQWLTINGSEGFFGYDLSKFPTSLVSLSSSRYSTRWSPDGHWLLHYNSAKAYCRDMTGAAPGAAQVVATAESINNQLIDSLSWSADSKSVALMIAPVTPASGPLTLQVFDPTQATPTLLTLSTKARWVRWAPSGDRIMYWEDNNVVHVRRVQSGVPGPDLTFDGSGSDYQLSPDGNFVRYSTSTELYLIDLTQTVPTPIKATSPSIATPTMTGASFSADGTRLLFSGVQIRDGQEDLFEVALKATLGAPVRLSTGLTGTATVLGFRLSPDGKSVIYTVSEVGQPSATWAVDLSGASPGAPSQISNQTLVTFTWVPNGSGNLLSPNNAGFAITSIPNATTSQLSGVGPGNNFSLAPVGALLAYGADPAAPHLYVRDLDHLEAPPADIPFLLSSGVRSWNWSPDGKFLATVEGVSTYQLRLVRLDGLTPSNALALNTSTMTPVFSWQPVSN